jgi:hypothetical protein
VSWRGLRYKGTERLLSREWNTAVDALNDLYGFLTSGQQDINVKSISAIYGDFDTRINCEGRPVILDGDPISIYQFYDLAKQQITEAIDKSTLPGKLDQIYGKLPSKDDVTGAINNANVTGICDLIREYTKRSAEATEAQQPKLDLMVEYTRQTSEVLLKVKMDEYGNVGVRISEPIDEYGRVQVSPPTELLEEYKPAMNSGSIAAADNTTGFSLTLYKGGRPNVNVYYSLGGAGNVYLKVSRDGVTWRTIKTYTLSAEGEGWDAPPPIAYPYVKLETDATGIDVEFEITASR